jgi:hypothetical protein
MVSMDGVMQTPSGPTEDPIRGFKLGGWVRPNSDQAGGEELMGRLFKDGPSGADEARRLSRIHAAQVTKSSFVPLHSRRLRGLQCDRQDSATDIAPEALSSRQASFANSSLNAPDPLQSNCCPVKG